LTARKDRLAERWHEIPEGQVSTPMRRTVFLLLIAALFAGWFGMNAEACSLPEQDHCAKVEVDCSNGNGNPMDSAAMSSDCVSGCISAVFVYPPVSGATIERTAPADFVAELYRSRLSRPDPFPPRLV
jgi:hypothetical protein